MYVFTSSSKQVSLWKKWRFTVAKYNLNVLTLSSLEGPPYFSGCFSSQSRSEVSNKTLLILILLLYNWKLSKVMVLKILHFKVTVHKSHIRYRFIAFTWVIFAQEELIHTFSSFKWWVTLFLFYSPNCYYSEDRLFSQE